MSRSAGPCSYRCGVSARWMPRTVAAAVLLAALLGSFRLEAGDLNSTGFPLRVFLMVSGGAMALWILRSGAEVRLVVALEDERVTLSYGGRRSSSLPLSRIEHFEFDYPMTASRRLLPAAVLLGQAQENAV